MVSRFVPATVIGLSLAAGAGLAACDTLVGLGPEATLRDAGGPALDAGVAADANGYEAAMPEAGSSCGLPPAGNMTCEMCSVQNCCPVTVACSMNAACAQASSKLLDCVYDPTCITEVDNEYADTGVVALQTCTLKYCIGVCFPGMVCSQLAQCCKGLASPLDQVCIDTVNQLDEANCEKVLDDTLRAQLGSQFCGGPAPVDAGRE